MRMSFWESHKHTIYMFGQIYATVCGLVVINYNLQRQPQRLAVGYSHVMAALLIVAAPLYFFAHLPALLESPDPRWRLLLLVSLANTAIKYMTVVVTYVANLIHSAAVREFAQTRQRLEDELTWNEDELDEEDDRPRTLFERRLVFKFGLVNLMMLLQTGNIVCLWFTQGANTVRLQVSLYTFVLWNYTENMANYFYFINSSGLRFYQQLDQRLQHLVRRAEVDGGRAQGDRISNDLNIVSALYTRIHRLYTDSVAGHQLQLLGLVLTTLISNLTNSFTLFNLFDQHSWTAATPAIAINAMHALAYYVDTYVVALVSENIDQELLNIGLTMRSFGQIADLDPRLARTVDNFSLRLLHTRSRDSSLICGLFNLDRRLVFLTAATVFTYFITLVQFDLSLTRV